MAYNTRRIKKDLDEKPIPQVYNPVADEYEPLQGSAAGGNRVQLYDGDGNPVGVATDAKLEAARVLLASLDDKDYATQAKQDDATAVLDAISTAVAARATEATLAQIKTALTDGSLKAQLSGSVVKHVPLRSTDTTVAAGAYYYGPVQSDEGGSVALAIYLSAARKHKQSVEWRHSTVDISLGASSISDNSTTGKLNSSGRTDKHCRRWLPVFYNADTTDAVIKYWEGYVWA